jgi:hypothetical protein
MPYKDDINIELLYPSDLFLKGEELFERKAVVDITNVEKGLYNFIIKDGSNIEVEWLKPMTRYQKATCSCNFFKDNKVCKHIIAALLAYKDTLVIKPQETLISEKHATLNINNVLNGVSKEELKNFIKTYARTDKKFSTALKVQFARKVNLRDNEKKYKSLLDSVIRPISNDKTHIKISDAKSLLNIVDDFYNQAQDSMAIGEFGEAFYLCKVSLTKLCYVYHYTDFLRTELENEINKNHSLLSLLLAESKSHELSETIIGFIVELINYSYYPFIDIDDNGIIILKKYNKLPMDLQETVKTQLNRKKEFESQITYLLSIDIIVKHSHKESLLLPLKYQSYINKVAMLLLDKGKYMECINFCNGYLSDGGDIVLIYLKALMASKSKKLISEMAHWFVASQNLSIVDYAINVLSAEEQLKFREGVNRLYKKSKMDDPRYYYFLGRTNQLAVLLKMLSDKKDLRMLMTYDHYLVPVMEHDLGTLYEGLLEAYLTQHIGNHSQIFIAEIFDHLNKIKAMKITKRLGLMIDMKFSHRMSLEDIYRVQH